MSVLNKYLKHLYKVRDQRGNYLERCRLIVFITICLIISACENRKIKLTGFDDLLMGSEQIILYENGEFYLELGAGGTTGRYTIKNDTIHLSYIDKPGEGWPNKFVLTDNYFISADTSKKNREIKIPR